jgi:hypothetical protein
MSGSITIRDSEGNVLMIARYGNLNGRKSIEIFAKALYGTDYFTSTLSPDQEEEDSQVKQAGLGSDDYWLPDISSTGDNADCDFKD